MQRYNNITECIKMCDRILRSNSCPRNDITKSEFVNSEFILSSKSLSSEVPLFKQLSTFHPTRTIVVQNFLPEAEVHVRSFVALFGITEVCEIIRDDARSCLAVIQYKSKTSAADALLAMPYCQECTEKRVVCVGHLPKNISSEAIRKRCERYGKVNDVKVQPQDQGAFAYVVFQSPLSAAVATYCLRNSSTSSAALMLGYSENGSPVLLGPVRVRPLDQYPVPLTAFDVRCICTRFLDYSRLKGLFVNFKRKMPVNHFFKPGTPEFCIRIPTSQVKGVSLFLEVLLFDGNFLKNAEDITDLAYQLCNHKHLFRFSVDFGLHKPIMAHDRMSRPNPQYLRWNSFFILDLQVCVPWGHADPRLQPRIQSMNHIYSDVDGKVFDEDSVTSSWFGGPLRHTSCNLSISGSATDDTQHRNKIKFLIAENLPLVRLVGSYEETNAYQLPVHAYSDVQSNFKIA
ncbi:uncharacterized protein LOC118205176 isoform X2 [Stegodyphus dumicola]|uniref:uncharacterized protein LOC118205176 isoform X2 n=1 Tax=Stegodyphus dumicola TaxID=202533 RepID=UPI0015AF451B|nr:uncharacterized protein LOC118205176 isoform X2 [Stegodyphus dumicola]